MGAVVAAPISAAGTCIGGCCGSFLAAGCWKLAGSGNVSSERAASCVLVWLQVFVTALCVILASTAGRWLSWTCGKLGLLGLGELGICACSASDSEDCWSRQVVYRVEASGVLVFTALLMMTVSGCALGASRTHIIAKFLVVFPIVLLLLLLPSNMATGFGSMATVASSVFLVAQSILLIDFAYIWNEVWYANALASLRREIGQRGYLMWSSAIVVASVLLLLFSLISSGYVFVAFPEPSGRAVNATAMILAFILMLFSVTDWCPHGALLTSTVVMTYTAWLVVEMLAVLPSGGGPNVPGWIRLAICGISLTSMTTTPANGRTPSREQPLWVGVDAAAAGSSMLRAVPSEGAIDLKGFALQCAVHAAAALYITAAMYPEPGLAAYICRAVAAIVSVLLYAWSLVAPMVLTGRSFG